MENAWPLVVGRKTEAFEGVGPHDTVHVQRAVGVVGRSAGAGVGAVQVQEPEPEWERKQSGLNLLRQACAKRQEEHEKGSRRPAQTGHLKNSRVNYFVEK